jgi:uncharacterized protein YecT (DUF1311 family)
MRTIKLTLLGLAFSLPALAFAEALVLNEQVMRDECGDNFFHQVEVGDCLQKKARKSLKVLRQANKKMSDAFSKWVENEKHVSLTRAKFAASNEDFVKYRYAQCEFIASLSGGIHLDFRRSACVAELNNRRTKELRNVAANLGSQAKMLGGGKTSGLGKKTKDSQKVLQQTEKEVSNAVSKWDQLDMFIRLTQRAFASASKKFIKHSDTHCKFIASLSGSSVGDSFESSYLACATELNYTRTKQLRDVASYLRSRAKEEPNEK